MWAWPVVVALLVGLAPAAALARQAAPPAVPIALTFDDLPAHGPLPPGETRLTIINSILDTLRRQHVREAYGFVAGSFGQDDPLAPAVLKAWRSAGFPLANHSWSHANLDSVDADMYVADIVRNEAVLTPLMRGKDWHWFRYPYLAEGQDPAKRDAVRAALTARGYRIAAVSLSFDDYAYNEPYARCATKGDRAAIARLETLYLQGASARLAEVRANGGGQIVLMHVGAFTARMLPQLLASYRSAGSRFVPLAQAAETMRQPSAPEVYSTPFAELAGTCAG